MQPALIEGYLQGYAEQASIKVLRHFGGSSLTIRPHLKLLLGLDRSDLFIYDYLYDKKVLTCWDWQAWDHYAILVSSHEAYEKISFIHA